MKNYKHLILTANCYYIRQMFSLAYLFILLFTLIGFVLIFFSDFPKAGCLLLAILALCFVLSKTTHKSTIKIILEGGKATAITCRYAQFRPSISYPISDLQRLTVRKTYYMHIPINSELLAEFAMNGKHKTIILSQSIRVKMIQHLYNELEDLLEFEDKTV